MFFVSVCVSAELSASLAQEKDIERMEKEDRCEVCESKCQNAWVWMNVTHVVSIQAIWYRYRYPKSIASDPLYKHISNLLSVNQAIFMSIHDAMFIIYFVSFGVFLRCASYILQQIPKGSKVAVCQPKRRKIVQTFLKKKCCCRSINVSLIWWNEKLKKLCVCFFLVFVHSKCGDWFFRTDL